MAGSPTKKGRAGGLLYDNLRALITTVDQLRDVGLQNYVNLPRIVATGTQSAGKSSVLESVCGLDCLPRGDGVVTRRPLELRLVHLSSIEYAENEAWAVFQDMPDKKITDFSEVKASIDQLTDQVAGTNRGIVDKPIVMTVYSGSCPDLTVIDLPGITRVPIKGTDQREDIEKVTREMTLRYIKDPRTIILAVIPANQDVSTSDALQLARQVDPQGLRTIGVITKIDLMDRGTDAMRMLKGEDIPLRLGYCGVKLRSQQEIKEGKKVKDAIEDEGTWFAEHAKYSKLPPGLTGTNVLVDKLTVVLCHHIRQFLPQIKREVSERIRKCEDRLEELGDGVPEGAADRVQLMWTMISAYADMFTNTIRGKYDKRLTLFMQETKETQSGGAKVKAVFNDFLSQYDERGKSVLDGVTDEEIDTAVRMHEGDSLPGFPSPDTFEFLVLPHLRKVQEPSQECLQEVQHILEGLCQKIAKVVFRRFPKLGDIVLELTKDILAREEKVTQSVVENIVSFETGYLFTNDGGYLVTHGSMAGMYGEGPQGHPAPPPPQPQQQQQQQQQQAQRPEDVNSFVQRTPAAAPSIVIRELRARLDSYFKLVIRNTRDSVPKAIGFFLVRKMQDVLQFELYNQLVSSERMTELLGEPPHIMEERRTLGQELRVIKGAASVLQKDIASTLSVEDTLSYSSPPASRPAAAPAQQQRAGAAGGQFASGGAFAPAQRPAYQPGVSGGGYPASSTPPVPAPVPTKPVKKGLFD